MIEIGKRKDVQAILQDTDGDIAKKEKGTVWWLRGIYGIGMIVAVGCFYVIGNPNLSLGFLSQRELLFFSYPFLAIFAVLCWLRLDVALALFPLTLPYYTYSRLLWRGASSDLNFTLAEIVFAICLLVAVLRLLLVKADRIYIREWLRLPERSGPFFWLMLVFILVGGIGCFIAFSEDAARRTFRQEVLEPIIYLALIVTYLHTRRDLLYLVGALIGAGLSVALFGLGQYFFFHQTLIPEFDGLIRVSAVYGSANSVGLFLDYTLPLVIALGIIQKQWRWRLLAIVLCIPMIIVLYLSQSRGAWGAIGIAAVVILGVAIRNRRMRMVYGGICLVGMVLVISFFGGKVESFLIGGHSNESGFNTTSKRIYIWQSAWYMIEDSPWLGYGMDNWLCHFSTNKLCEAPKAYWILKDPVTGVSTGLSDEPTLSHPHNIFLHVWESMGIFGLLSLLGILGAFFWMLIRLLQALPEEPEKREHLDWILIALGATMLAMLIHGQVDNAFFSPDLSYAFWILVGILLISQRLLSVSWRKSKPQVVV